MDEKGLPKKGSIGRPKRSEAGAKQIELMERRKRVAELHTQGLYWTAIGLELGISDTQAANDWKAWMAECREYPGREAQREFARASYESDLEAANRDIARAEAAVEAALTVTTSTTLDGKPIMVGGPESFVKVEAALDRVNGGTELSDDKQALAAAVQRLLDAEREYSAAFGELLTVAAADAGAGLWNAVCDGQEQYNELLKSVIRIRQAYRSEVGS